MVNTSNKKKNISYTCSPIYGELKYNVKVLETSIDQFTYLHFQ